MAISTIFKRLSLASALLLVMGLGVSAQGTANRITVSGTVTDDVRQPLIGASVVVKGANIGVTTDTKGNFRLQAPSDGTLVISYVGFKPREVPVSGQTTLKVELEPTVNEMETIVFTGYGNLTKADMTGSVSVLNMDDVGETGGVSLAGALQGRIAGLQVTSNSGAPGSASTMLLRGSSSISGSNQPLIVIDGVPMENEYINPGNSSSFNNYLDQPPTDVLSTINQKDIVSMQFLKDASSTAIYGSRGANGVMLITTRQGQAGKPKISFSARMDIGLKPKEIPVLSTSEFFDWLDEAYYNSTGGPTPTKVAENRVLYGHVNTDWQDEIYRMSYNQDYQLSISGGRNEDRYSLNAGVTDMQGSILKTYYRRMNIRFNNTRKLADRLTMQFSANAFRASNSRMPGGASAQQNTSTVLNALASRPYGSPYTDEGEIDGSSVTMGNPVSNINGTDDVTVQTHGDLNLKFDYKWTPWLTLTYQLSGGYNATTRDVYWSELSSLGYSQGNRASHSPGESYNYRSVVTANINRTFKQDHRLNAVLAYEWAYWNNSNSSAMSTNFPNDYFRGNNLGFASDQLPNTSSTTEKALKSYIARVNYTYKNRYVAMLTGRADGSSLLAPDNRWDFFPSLGLAWNVDQEKFMRASRHIISSLKLRSSYGYTGNQTVPNAAYMQTMTAPSVSQGTSAWLPSWVYSKFANPYLRWERTRQFDVGFDAVLFAKKLRVDFDYYDRRTEHLLYQDYIPTSTGYVTYHTNNGTVDNKGVELTLNYDAVRRKEFSWTISANASHNRNKVMALGTPNIMGRSYPGSSSTIQLSIAKVGYPIGSFWGYKFDGIYQNMDQVNAGPTVGKLTPAPGDPRYKNLVDTPGSVNDISEADMTIIGNPYPKLVAGITNDFTYKNFSLSILIDGVFGQDVYNYNRAYTDGLVVVTTRGNGGHTYNASQRAYYNRWRGEGTSDYYPRARIGTTFCDGMMSDFLVEDATFVRLRNVTLSYTVNMKKYIQSVRVFVAANNMLTLTNYSGYDPEVNSVGHSAIDQGIDCGTPPVVRLVSVGVNVTF